MKKYITHLILWFGIGLGIPAYSANNSEGSRTVDPPLQVKDPEMQSESSIKMMAPHFFVVPLSAVPSDMPKVGEGFDLLTGSRKPTSCIAHGGVATTSIGSLQSYLSEVSDDEMLLRKLNTTIEAKANYAGWSGGGQYSETVETKVSTNKVVVVAKSTHVVRLQNLLPSKQSLMLEKLPKERIDLNAAAYDVVKRQRFSEFRSTCGDGYIAQISEGGHFYTTLEFLVTDFNSKKEIVAAINVAGPADVFKGSATTKLQEEMDKRKSDLKIQTFQDGGRAASNATTKAELLEDYKKFPTNANDFPKAVLITVVRYDSLPSVTVLPTYFKTHWIAAEQTMRQLLRLQTVRNDFANALVPAIANRGRVVNDPSYYFIPSIETKKRSIKNMKASLLTLQANTSQLGKFLAQCMSAPNPKNCQREPEFDTPQYDDLYWRALAPLSKTDAPGPYIGQLEAIAKAGGLLQKQSSCYFVQLVQANVIRRIAALRQKYDNVGDERRTQHAEDAVYEGVNVTKEECLQKLDPANYLSLVVDTPAAVKSDEKKLIEGFRDALLMPEVYYGKK